MSQINNNNNTSNNNNNNSHSSSRNVLQILERYCTGREYELKKSLDKQSQQFHTLRYDFKPASVNSNEPASLELTSKGEVTIKAPNIGGSSSNYTVFRGQRRPHVKECLLVIDNKTGEMVLQKLTDNITVKATRTLGNGAAPSTGITSLNGSVNSNFSVATPPAPISNNLGRESGGGGSSSGGGGNLTTAAASVGGGRPKSSNSANNDGPQLSEESSSSSDDDDDDDDDDGDSSDSSSSSSSSNSRNDSSSPSVDDGFTF